MALDPTTNDPTVDTSDTTDPTLNDPDPNTPTVSDQTINDPIIDKPAIDDPTSCWPEVDLDRAPERSRAEVVLAAVGFAAVTVVVAAGGSVINARAMDWYDQLEQPGFTPPDATFGIVWTILYALVAVAGWLAWRASRRPDPTIAWVAQMTLNFAWTAVFFGLRSPVGGLVVIAALLVAIVVNIVFAARVSKPAAWLLAPYLAWCGFATALNVGFVALN